MKRSLWIAAIVLTGCGGAAKPSATPRPTPVSSTPATPGKAKVAKLKTRPKPKGDYKHFDARKEYPVEARRLGIEGTIKVKLTVDVEGKVAQAVLLTKLGHGLDELALARAQEIEFEPAKDTDDHAIASVVVWTFNMTLGGEARDPGGAPDLPSAGE